MDDLALDLTLALVHKALMLELMLVVVKEAELLLDLVLVQK